MVPRMGFEPMYSYESGFLLAGTATQSLYDLESTAVDRLAISAFRIRFADESDSNIAVLALTCPFLLRAYKVLAKSDCRG